MGIYDTSIALALSMITKFGITVTLVQFVDAAPVDANEPWRLLAPTAVTCDVKAVIGTASAAGQHRDDKGPTLVHTNEKKLTIAASGMTFVPSTKGEVRIEGVIWKITEVTPVAPNNTPIVYIIRIEQ